ncbi:MAG TPA: nucleotidyltransferase domain-containing protein [Thermoanaerobaculia bacterium]|nr:nucleotidyltransferase domain-containing protein [Thermoanaerobaculia bacterium]
MNIPDDVQRVIDGLVASAREVFGEALRSAILFGSAAEGRMRATSDVNLLFVLSRFDRSVDAFREPFRFAQTAANVNAMFVLEPELDAAAEAFAQKFADIARRHVVLHGEDLVTHITISREALVKRLRQVLLNLTLRLRESYVERSLREEQCAIVVADTSGPLRTSAVSILELEGRGTMTPKEALAVLARELDPQFETLLPHLSEARERLTLPRGQAADILFATLELARAMHARTLRIDA